MPPEEDILRKQLSRWGSATINRFATNDDRLPDHVLAKNQTLAPGTRENYERPLVGRDGRSRRRYMAKKAGVKKMHIVPMCMVDPVRSKNDASPPRDIQKVSVDIGVPDDLRWIDRALAQMMRQHPLRADCLREEFCGRGTQVDKAKAVEARYGGRLSVWMYRREVQRAMDFLSARAAA